MDRRKEGALYIPAILRLEIKRCYNEIYINVYLQVMEVFVFPEHYLKKFKINIFKIIVHVFLTLKRNNIHDRKKPISVHISNDLNDFQFKTFTIIKISSQLIHNGK